MKQYENQYRLWSEVKMNMTGNSAIDPEFYFTFTVW